VEITARYGMVQCMKIMLTPSYDGGAASRNVRYLNKHNYFLLGSFKCWAKVLLEVYLFKFMTDNKIPHTSRHCIFCTCSLALSVERQDTLFCVHIS
jgi:hypothetical protein